MALDVLSLTRFCATLAVLLAASREDLRTRTVDDRYWQVLGGLGFALLALEMWSEGAAGAHYILLFPMALLFYDPYVDREPLYNEGKVCWPAAAGFALAAVAVAAAVYFGGLTELLVIPAMFVLIYVMYFTNVIHGGADAKALMSIALVNPWYPELSEGLPILTTPEALEGVVDVSFPFVLLVLMMASLTVMLLPLYNLGANARRGNLVLPMALFGRRMRVEEAEKAMVWPMETMVDGRLRRALFPKRGRNLQSEYGALRSAGIQEVWVTHKIPFIVPITAGLVLAAVVGNFVYWIGNALG
jgi:hypothetical protein